MQVGKFLSVVSLTISVIATVIAGFWLFNTLFTAHGSERLIGQLGNWVSALGLNLVLILLGTAAIHYLARKK